MLYLCPWTAESFHPLGNGVFAEARHARTESAPVRTAPMRPEVTAPPPPPPPYLGGSSRRIVSLWAALLVIAALWAAPVRAQTEIWSAEMTVGQGPFSNQRGFCSGCNIFDSGTFGSLSNDSFELDGTTYVVEGIFMSRGSTTTRDAGIDLDSLPAAAVWRAWTLQIGNTMIPLSGAQRTGSHLVFQNDAFSRSSVPNVGATVTVRLLEPAEPGIVVSPTSVATDENESTEEVMVSLATAPTATVTVALSSSDEDEATVSPTSLEFTSADWDTEQAVTVTGVDDDVVDGDQAYAIMLSATTTDSDYSGLTATIDGTNADAGDSVGIVMTPATVATDEGGNTAEVMVSLMSEPAGTVTVTVASSDAGEAAVSPASLEFTPSNWDTERTVVVTGQNDDIEDGEQTYVITAGVAAAPDDANYIGVSATIAGTNADDDAAAPGTVIWTAAMTVQDSTNSGGRGYCLDCARGKNVPDHGALSDADFDSGGTTHTVKSIRWGVTGSEHLHFELDPLPAAEVLDAWTLHIGSNAVPLSTRDTAEQLESEGFTVGPIRFAGWASRATVSAPAVNSTVTVSLTSSSAPVAADPGLVLSESNVATNEGGSTATVMVSLRTAPTAQVVLTVTSSAPDEATVSPLSLTFTTADWDTFQAITITGVDDAVDDGDVSYTITAGSTSTDSDYSGLTASISGVNADDDTAGIYLSATSVTTDEGGLAEEVAVSLTSEPTARVVLTVTSSDPGEATASPSTLTFGPGSGSRAWDAEQTVTVTGADDSIVDDGDQIYTIMVGVASSADSVYAGLSPREISGVNADNDPPPPPPAGETEIWSAAMTVGRNVHIGYCLRPGCTAVIFGTGSLGLLSDIDFELGGATYVVEGIIISRSADSLNDLFFELDGLPDAAVYEAWTLQIGGRRFALSGSGVSVNAGDGIFRIDDGYAGIFPPATGSTVTVRLLAAPPPAEAGIVLPAPNVSTAEGGTVEVPVLLATEPSGTVTLTITSSDEDEATVRPTALTFTPADWNVTQTFTVTGEENDVAGANLDYTITVSSSSAEDSDYNSLAPVEATGGKADNDTAGIELSTTTPGVSSEDTSEGGSPVRYVVSLMSEPRSAVTLSITSSDEGEATVSPTPLTFEPAAWGTPQTFTVTPEDDDVADGNQRYTIGVSATSGDNVYNGLSEEVSPLNIDDDRRGLVLSETNVATDEGGGTATVAVSLMSEPTAPVTVTLASAPEAEATVSPGSLVFAPADWDTELRFTVTGADDDVVDGDQTYEILLTPSGGDYGGGEDETMPGVNADDDEAGIFLRPPPGAVRLSTDEGGRTALVMVSLRSEPTSAVTLSISSDVPTEATASPASLEFGPGNWNTVQVFTVTGEDDGIEDGRQSYAITVQAFSGDGDYNGQAAVVRGDNADDDMAAILLRGSVLTGEDGTEATVTVSLATEPKEAVTLTITSSNPREADVEPVELTFMPADWNTGQTFRVAGITDAVADGNQAYTITVSVSSSGDDYEGLSAEIAGENVDDDEAGIVLSTTSVSTDERGVTDTVEVSLMSEPTRAVMLRLSSSDTGEARVSPTALTFGTGNWNTSQTVTVTGRNDDVDDGDEGYTITVTARSGDSGYNGRTQTISGVNVDDDMVGFVLDPADGGSLGTIAEDGGTARFTATLRSEPAARTRVVLGVASSSADRAGVSRAALTFTSSNWDRPQMVTVRGVDNDISDGDAAVEVTVSVAAAPATTDTDYTTTVTTAQSLSVTVMDDDSPHFILAPMDGGDLGTIDEDGGTARFTAVLGTKPADGTAVVLGVEPTATTDRVSLSASALTFAPSDWNITQTVMVTGAANNVADGPATVTVAVSVAAAPATTDTDYTMATLAVQSLSITVKDDNFPDFALSPEGVLPEVSLGETATLSVYLGAEPAQPVTLTVTHTPVTVTAAEGGSAVSLTPSVVLSAYGKGNSQTVTVSIAEDAVEEEFSFEITVAPDPSSLTVGASAGMSLTLTPMTATVSVVRRGQPEAEAVQGAMAVLDGAGGARLAADLIARRASGGADDPRTVLGGADLFAEVDRAGLSSEREAEQESDPFGDRADYMARRPDVVRTLAGSGFSRSLDAGGGRSLAVWGAGAAVDVGIEVDGYETEYEGNVYGAQVGVEMRAGPGVAVGVAVGAGWGELKARNSKLRRIEREMLSVHPYLAWNGDGFEGWLAVGFGAGDYTVETEDGDRASADASTAMLGAGVGTRWEAGGFDLALRASAVGSRSELDEALDLPRETNGVVPDGTKSEFWRLRAEVEAGRTFEGAGGAVLRPYATAGGRQDGGDGPTGGAGELGLGLRLGLDRNLTADLSGRVQVTDADLEEKSLSGSLRYDHGADGRGLLLSAGSDRRYVDAEGDDGSEWTAVHRGRIGYGWAGSVLRRTARSELYMSGSRGDGSRGPRLGAEFDAAPLSLGISGGRGEMRLEMDYRF